MAAPVMNGDIVTINTQLQNLRVFGDDSKIVTSTDAIPSYDWYQYRIWLLTWGGTNNPNQYTTITDTSMPITTGAYIGLELVPPNASSGDPLQTGPETGSNANTVQNQGSSWSDGSGDAEFRVWMLVSTDGNGYLKTEGSNSNSRQIIGKTGTVTYGSYYYVQSVGKAIGKNDYMWWLNSNQNGLHRITVYEQNFPWSLNTVSNPSTFTQPLPLVQNAFYFNFLDQNNNIPTTSTCMSNSDCSNNQECTNGTCVIVSPNSCGSSSDCPTGQVCSAGLCSVPSTVSYVEDHLTLIVIIIIVIIIIIIGLALYAHFVL